MIEIIQLFVSFFRIFKVLTEHLPFVYFKLSIINCN